MATVKNVNLYYVGGLANPKALVTAKGMSFRVPVPGEFLSVPFYIARDLIRRNTMPDGRAVFTTDGALVKRMMAEVKEAANTKPQKLTREQLLEMLNDLDADIQVDFQEGAKAAKKSVSVKKVEDA